MLGESGLQTDFNIYKRIEKDVDMRPALGVFTGRSFGTRSCTGPPALAV